MEVFDSIFNHVMWFLEQKVVIGGFTFSVYGAVVFGVLLGVFFKVIRWLFDGD